MIHPFSTAVVKVTGYTGSEERIGFYALRKSASCFIRSRNDGGALQAFGSEHSRHDRSDQAVGREQRRRGDDKPCKDRTLVERIQRSRYPSDQHQQRNHGEPPRYDVAHQGAGIGSAARQAVRISQREHEQRQNQVGTIESAFEPEGRDDQDADRYRRIDRATQQGDKAEFAERQARLGILEGRQGWNGRHSES